MQSKDYIGQKVITSSGFTGKVESVFFNNFESTTHVYIKNDKGDDISWPIDDITIVGSSVESPVADTKQPVSVHKFDFTNIHRLVMDEIDKLQRRAAELDAVDNKTELICKLAGYKQRCADNLLKELEQLESIYASTTR